MATMTRPIPGTGSAWAGEAPARPLWPGEKRAREEARRKTLFRLAKNLPPPHGEQARAELVKSLASIEAENDPKDDR